MGVPGLIAWLYRNYKNKNFVSKQLFKSQTNVSENVIEEVDHLLLDANGLVYAQLTNLYNEIQPMSLLCETNNIIGNNDIFEKKLIKHVIDYINIIINTINPKKTIYISFDGVAPMAKIKQQRQRRFKLIYDREMKNRIAEKYKKQQKKEWCTAAITPGTLFMDKLMKSINIWIHANKFNIEKVILSSSYTSGEGEYKIFRYIKENIHNNNDNIIVYGLDADLLFLSLASQKNNLFLMRETSEVESNTIHTEGFSYISINSLKRIIKEIIVDKITHKNIDTVRVITDFVFLCFLCGNDFVPHIPSLSIKPHNYKIINGLDSIINAYVDMYEKTEQYILDEYKKINREILIEILNILSDQEQQYYTDFYNNRRIIKKSESNDPYEIELHKFNNNIIPNYNDPIKLGDPTHNILKWKQNYYTYYFEGVKINDIINEYIHGLVWNKEYYFDKCKNYEWFYPYFHGPFLSDIRDYIIKNPECIGEYESKYEINAAWFERQIKPLHQLLLVLPLECSYLVSTNLRNVMYDIKMKQYFPNDITEIKMDNLYKNNQWQNIPIINIIPPRKILYITSNIVLTDDEINRNKEYEEVIIKKDIM